MPYLILKYLWTPIHYIEDCFYHFLMTYVDEINGSINHTPSYAQPKLRSNDRAFMEIALESDSFTVTQLRRINCVRMYLGFTYLSELCNPNGRSINTGILSRTRDSGPYRTTLSRPNQPWPNILEAGSYGNASLDQSRALIARLSQSS